MENIAEELLKTIKYISPQERKSRWYREYLEKVHEDLINENFKK